jgi:hypothetical protein
MKEKPMEATQTKSWFGNAPSWGLAVAMFFAALIVFVITDSIWTPRSETGLESHLINDGIIALGCFFIVRENPKSIWYVPLICNAFLILSAIFEHNFWKSAMFIPISGGWALSVLGSIIAAQQGKRKRNNIS